MAATKPAFNPPGKKGDMIFSALVKLAALIVLLLLGGIIVSLIFSSWPSIQKFGFAFLWTKEWDAPNDIYGALVPIYGTLVTSFIALLIAVPVSFGIALFLTELAPGWLRRPLGIAIELLAAIPSIVYGMWGLFIFAPLFATYFQEPVGNVLSAIPFVGALFSGPAFGIGILAAGVILAIMIIPYIAAVMRDVFEQTPVMMKESAYQKRRDWRRDARSGTRAGRNHGGHLYHRQHLPARQRLALYAGEQYYLCAGERICRSGIRAARRRADGTGSDPVCYHLYCAGYLQADDYASG